MEVTRELYKLNLLPKLMLLLYWILFNLAIIDIAEVILIQISAELMPSLHRILLGT